MCPAVASLVAGDLIEAARDEHPSFTEQRHPDPVLVRGLSRYQRRLVARLVQVNRTVLTQVQETALPLADFDTGITLVDYKYPAAVEVELPPETGGGPVRKYQVELVPWQGRLRHHLGAYIRDHVLYLTGTAQDWVGFTKVRFFYIPEVEALTATTGAGGALVLPNAAEPCLVAYLASVMAQRGIVDGTLERADARVFRQNWREAEDEFLAEMGTHVQAQYSVIRETF